MADDTVSLVLFSGTNDRLQAAAVLVLGVHLVPCQRMDLLGLTNADLIDGLEEPAGATTALLEARGAVTLFI